VTDKMTAGPVAVATPGRPDAATEPGWVLCRPCGSVLFRPQLARNLWVCPECGHYHPLTAAARLDLLLDPQSLEPLVFPLADHDPLGFADSVPYPQRLAAARRATGLAEAVLCARGTIAGTPVICTVMDFRFMGGSLGCAVGELITRAAETALSTRTPLVIVTASGGARMQEGALALMQMAKTSQAMAQLDEAGIMTIALVADPTFGGVAASFTMLCDVVLAEPKARLGFAGRRVIEQTIRQTLPPDFQTAEFLVSHGLIDAICPRHALRTVLGNLLSTGSRGVVPHPAGYRPLRPGPEVLITDPDTLPRRDAWKTVRAAREVNRPTTADYISLILDGFEELHGDRIGGDSAALIGGLARLDSLPIMVIGHQKGHTAAELAARDYGMASPAGYRKAARLMRIAAKLGLPVLTLIDTPGAYPGMAAEEQGQAVAIAESLRLMAGLPVPIVAVVTGEGGSGGALALGVADRVFALSNAVYSVISPEGCAAILWHDPAAAPRAAAALGLDAPRLLRLGIIDGVIPEPDGGAAADVALMAGRLRSAAVAAFTELLPLTEYDILSRRHARFRRFGTDTAAAGLSRDEALSP
jgi:acetyl-CoA carboxylase carboxyl transferase alpha subunit/acetyl-CoA carboxylase carboxyl transferase beta subunit